MKFGTVFTDKEQEIVDKIYHAKLNLMIARVFFGMEVESDYFREIKNARFEKLKLLAS